MKEKNTQQKVDPSLTVTHIYMTWEPCGNVPDSWNLVFFISFSDPDCFGEVFNSLYSDYRYFLTLAKQENNEEEIKKIQKERQKKIEESEKKGKADLRRHIHSKYGVVFTDKQWNEFPIEKVDQEDPQSLDKRFSQKVYHREYMITLPDYDKTVIFQKVFVYFPNGRIWYRLRQNIERSKIKGLKV